MKKAGDILIWIAIILLILLSLLNLSRTSIVSILGLLVAVGIILYWFFKGRHIIK